MSKKALYLLIAFLVLHIVLHLIQLLGFEPLLFSKTVVFQKMYLTMRFLVPLIFFASFLTHITFKKYWLILVTQLIAILTSFFVSLSYYLAVMNWYQIEPNLYNLLNELIIWIIAINAIAFIWTGIRKQVAWLTLYGISLAVYVCASFFNIFLDDKSYDWVLQILVEIPSLPLLAYLISEYKSAER